jgi:hypothetical protein
MMDEPQVFKYRGSKILNAAIIICCCTGGSFVLEYLLWTGSIGTIQLNGSTVPTPMWFYILMSLGLLFFNFIFLRVLGMIVFEQILIDSNGDLVCIDWLNRKLIVDPPRLRLSVLENRPIINSYKLVTGSQQVNIGYQLDNLDVLLEYLEKNGVKKPER